MNSYNSRSNDSAKWYCLRSQPRREFIASDHLRCFLRLEVFLPKITQHRKRSTGIVKVTEAMFPNYLFCKFSLEESLQQVNYAHGLSHVVKFKGHPAVVPEETIAFLKQITNAQGVFEHKTDLNPGDKVHVAHGPLKGFDVLVTKVLSVSQRIGILFSLLGRETEVVLNMGDVIKFADHHPLQC